MMADLASYVSERLGGRALPILKGKKIVFDPVSGEGPTVREVASIVGSFLHEKSLEAKYRVSEEGESVCVTSVSGGGETGRRGLPPNLFMCTHCGFATSYEELYQQHVRIHYV